MKSLQEDPPAPVSQFNATATRRRNPQSIGELKSATARRSHAPSAINLAKSHEARYDSRSLKKEENFMHHIEAPQTYNGNATSLFLAGGITNCPDWQKDMIEKLKDTPLVLFNPRRVSFPIEDKNAARVQIEWEHIHLRKATAISFWFPCETLNPIVLYELGAWSMTDKKLFVGVHPAYPRVQDVRIQTALVRPDIQVVSSIEVLVQEITSWTQNFPVI
jgi:hypothetical protein